MSKFSAVIIASFLMVLIVSGSPDSESTGPKSGYCHRYGVDIKEGEGVSAPVGTCAHLICRSAAENDVSAMQCGLIAFKKGCKLQHEDLTKPYPECCGRVIC